MTGMSARGLSRRGFLGFTGAAIAAPALAVCNVSGGSGSASNAAGRAGGVLKFWDMPWGAPAYNAAGKKLVEAYVPAGGLPKTSNPGWFTAAECTG